MDRMPSEEQFVCVNIRDFLNPEETGGIGEDDLEKILSDFSSPKNSDVESFLKKNAIEFTKKNQSVTYLVFSLEDMCCLPVLLWVLSRCYALSMKARYGYPVTVICVPHPVAY